MRLKEKFSPFQEDAYFIHRVALQPVLPHRHEKHLVESCHHINQIGETNFLHFLLSQGLASMWHEALHKTTQTNLVSDNFITTLHQNRLASTGLYLIQSQELKFIKSTLDSKKINHVIFKGCHTREVIYNEPAVRPASDIDILISPNDKIKAIQAFVNAGYEFIPNAENISHEVSLEKKSIVIDLHWDIMRPGRTRIPMNETLCKTKMEFSNYWGLNNEATLFIMLVHPVFTKYATSPYSSLMRIVDMAFWIEQRECDWDQLLSWLEIAGMKTSAWIMLQWLQLLTSITPPKNFMHETQPGKLKSSYLQCWIKNNYASRFYKQPLLIQTAFLAPAHDKQADHIRAIKDLIREKKLKRSIIKNLETEIKNTSLQ